MKGRRLGPKTIPSENEIEEWHLRQSAKTVPLLKTGTINSVFLFLDGSGVVESIALSTLHRSIEKIRQKYVIYRYFYVD